MRPRDVGINLANRSYLQSRSSPASRQPSTLVFNSWSVARAGIIHIICQALKRLAQLLHNDPESPSAGFVFIGRYRLPGLEPQARHRCKHPGYSDLLHRDDTPPFSSVLRYQTCLMLDELYTIIDLNTSAPYIILSGRSSVVVRLNFGCQDRSRAVTRIDFRYSVLSVRVGQSRNTRNSLRQ